MNKHYKSTAQKALPAIVFGIMSIPSEIETKCLPLFGAIVRCETTLSEEDFQDQLLQTVEKTSRPNEINSLDTGLMTFILK